MRIEPINGLKTSNFGVSTAVQGEESNFGDALVKAFERASEAERAADDHIGQFVEGNAGIHETVMAQERAGLMLRYAVTLKNRAIDAYRELMNTQI